MTKYKSRASPDGIKGKRIQYLRMQAEVAPAVRFLIVSLTRAFLVSRLQISLCRSSLHSCVQHFVFVSSHPSLVELSSA